MKSLKYKVLVLFFLIVSSVTAQEKYVEKGDESFNAYNFINAQKEYLEGIETTKNNASLYRNLGEAYYKVADYENAAKWLKEWYYFSDTKEKEPVLKYAQALKSIGNYKLSDSILNIKSDYLETIEANSGRFDIKTVSFNSELLDFAPTFYGENLVFASNREVRGASKNIHKWNNQPFLDLYMVSLDSLTNTIERLDNGLNTKYHESTAVFTKDGNVVYFTRNNFLDKNYKSDSNGINRLKLYKGNKGVNGDWNVLELPFNSDEFSVAHPALSLDETILYFSSDMPGGKGESDLYRVAIGKEDTFSTPENLGDIINTDGRDTFPFIGTDNRLYFASDGHLGLGGLDVFVSEISDDGFSDVYNVGRPVNTQQDDFSFIMNSNGKGFFASNREGTGNDNIFSFVETKPLLITCQQTISGNVENSDTNDKIANAKVVLFNESGDLVSEVYTNENGSYNFSIDDCDADFTIKVTKENFTVFEKQIRSSKVKDDTIEVNAVLDIDEKSFIGSNLNDLLSLEPIFFNFDKSRIKKKARTELEKVISFMNKYPSLNVQIQSYADSRGDKTYNLKLSKTRAESTVKYIIEEGAISEERLSTIGFGEDKLINECADGVKCSEKKHQLNRRSEFVVID